MGRRLIHRNVAVLFLLAACSSPREQDGDAVVALGPVDGRELSATDLDRVSVGESAPDFSLMSLAGPIVTLSSFRGQQNVVLVFYRGHW